MRLRTVLMRLVELLVRQCQFKFAEWLTEIDVKNQEDKLKSSEETTELRHLIHEAVDDSGVLPRHVAHAENGKLDDMLITFRSHEFSKQG